MEADVEYYCKENDNAIMIQLEDGELDEICVGCRDLPTYGFSVVGRKDLDKALGLAGYKIVKTKKEEV